jgi:hypothetical protein
VRRRKNIELEPRSPGTSEVAWIEDTRPAPVAMGARPAGSQAPDGGAEVAEQPDMIKPITMKAVLGRFTGSSVLDAASPEHGR